MPEFEYKLEVAFVSEMVERLYGITLSEEEVQRMTKNLCRTSRKLREVVDSKLFWTEPAKFYAYIELQGNSRDCL